MSKLPKFIETWIVACASDQTLRPLLTGTIGIKSPLGEFAIDMSRSKLVDDVGTTSAWVEGSDECLEQISKGLLSLQSAHIKGILTISGDPSTLMAFTTLVESGLKLA